MQPPSAAVEESARQRQQSQHQRVEPDQRIEEEVGAQAAQPAVLLARELRAGFGAEKRPALQPRSTGSPPT